MFLCDRALVAKKLQLLSFEEQRPRMKVGEEEEEKQHFSATNYL